MRTDEIILSVAAVSWIPLSLLEGWAARAYQRSPAAWFALSMIFSPLVAYVFLIVANVPHDAVLRQQNEDRVRKRDPGCSDVRELSKSETACPHCGAAINLATGAGTHAPNHEPWRLICNACSTEIVL